MTIAATGLLLMNAHSLIGAIGKQQLMYNLVGTALFIYSFWTVGKSYLNAEADDNLIAWSAFKTAVTIVCAISFLTLGRLAHLDPRVHGLSNILGWLLVLVSFTLPSSRWQPIALFAIYAIALSGAKWRQFLAFSDIETHLLIGLIVLWVAVSGSIFLFLVRRKPAMPPQGLN
jgi:hypothetical protein